MEQQYQSSGTSRKQVPKLFRKIKLTGVNLDIGGGKFDQVQENYGHEFTNLVYDPFNRSEAHNQEVLEKAASLGVNSVTICNVLNVIKEDEIILEILHMAAWYSYYVYVSIYEGDKTGIGKVTTKGYQRNEHTSLYIPMFNHFFKHISITGNIVSLF